MKFIKKHQNTELVLFPESCSEGEYGIPYITPLKEPFEMCEFISFNYAMSTKYKSNLGCHFYVDDYQFERLWNEPRKYIDLLSGFKYVLTPDFSMFTDFPMALQIYNHYRKHWLGALMQMYDINVIPTICWSDKESFKWCFDGEPRDSIVSVSSVGVCQSKRTIEAFMEGYKAMLEKLTPTQILFFGKPIVEEYMDYAGNIVLMENKMRTRLIELNKKKENANDN